MIPKIIHYCWFGHNPLSNTAQRCIESWHRFLPDYEIKEWNEDNFDVNSIPYTQQAYEAKKYAFVSDYARFWILYHEGGLYFDTDVELVASLDTIVARGNFMGIEKGASLEGYPMVNPGLGLGAEVGLLFYERMLQMYGKERFIKTDGTYNNVTIVYYTTKELYNCGMKPSESMQEIDGIWIYPADYFCPMDSTTGIITKTKRTVAIHHYDCSWMDHNTLSFRIHQLKNCFYRIIGQKNAQLINKLLH